ncbi:MAG: hypothetical protein WDW36_001074 [Sanguina aurantia]
MPFGQLVIGPPGSGKTTYCNGMQQFMRAAGRKVEIVNLDPANDGLPYLPAIDLSDLVGLEEVMEEFKLGPNGANTYILFDCPGQVELFTMHGSFQSIIKTITGDWAYRLTAVHLVDAHLCTDPSKFVSGLLLSLSTMLHLELPHVNVLSKIDLVRQYGQLAFNLDYFTEDKDSIQRLLVLVDKANGHVYAAMAGHSPYPAELLYGSAPLGTDKDMWMTYQERYLEGEVAERVIDEERNKGHAAALRSFASVAAAQSDASRPHELEGKVLHPSLLNDNVLKTEYAVRGELYLRAEQLRKEGKEIMFTNVGNPHALGAKPMTFTRQVLALCAAPFLLDHPQVETMFPADAIARARRLLSSFKGGMGAYTDSRGNPMVREEVAKFIERRDNVPSNPDHIFLTDGASVAVRMCLNATIRSPLDGILVPIPQYPLYSASIKLYGGALVAYYLDEKRGWALDTADMKRAVEEARAEGKSVRGLVFINPGNPTGQCLSVDNLKELIKFAYDERIVLMADEVYQENIYQDERPFVSAKKVLSTMGEPYASGTELLSFHTISKGTGGECGLRGGYVEMTNIHPGTIEEVYKCASINLSPNTMGQIAMSILMNPPKPGDESYETWATERGSELSSLRRRAQMVTDGFNAMEGMTCNFTEGAMYSFPQLKLPAKAMAAADAAGKAGDVFYCLKLLESTGISTVPGSGFGQEEGTFHLRTTILPREELMPAFVEKFKSFHSGFMQQYR